MIALKIEEVKKFMGLLLNSETFDGFLIKGAEIRTATAFSVDGRLNPSFFDEKPEKQYAYYKDIRPVIFELIKGKRTPLGINIVLIKDDGPNAAYGRTDAADTAPAAAGPERHAGESPISSRFLNIRFEKGELMLSTGVSYESFTLSKAGEYEWDEEVKELIKKYGTAFSVAG